MKQTDKPTHEPTPNPTVRPTTPRPSTRHPSPYPTIKPTRRPTTRSPTSIPTNSPTESPTLIKEHPNCDSKYFIRLQIRLDKWPEDMAHIPPLQSVPNKTNTHCCTWECLFQ